MNTQTPSIIFSIWRKDLPPSINECAVRYAKRVLIARGIPYYVAEGCYKGEREPCFILQDVAENLAAVQLITRRHRQESILRVDSKGAAYLESPTGDWLTELGKFHRVAPVVAEKLGAWTKFNGQYWVAS